MTVKADPSASVNNGIKKRSKDFRVSLAERPETSISLKRFRLSYASLNVWLFSISSVSREHRRIRQNTRILNTNVIDKGKSVMRIDGKFVQIPPRNTVGRWNTVANTALIHASFFGLGIDFDI